MDVFNTYTYGTAGWLAIQAVPLLLTPKLIITFLADEAHSATDLEMYFSRGLALALLTLSILLITLNGSIPLTNEGSAGTTSAPEDNDKAPYAVPSILISTIFQASSAFFTYACYTSTRQFGFAVAALVWTVLSSTGLWCLMFGTESGRISRRTGADKRTSAWPFKNAEADKKRSFKKGL